MYFIIFISFVIFQRLLELFVSSKNEKWLLKNGAVEYGKSHYPFIVAMHTLFLLSMIVEYSIDPLHPFHLFFLILFFLLIAFKIWTIGSLGHYWNTKIYRIQGSSPVATGPYKFFRHPNYIIVVCEIIVIPLVFQLYYTAIIFTVLNAIMLTVRIKEENKTWKSL